MKVLRSASIKVMSATLIGLLIALFGSPLRPAAADPFGPAEDRTTSVVTRLTLGDDGVGWLTLHPRFYSTAYTGFDVFVPAGDGAWTGPAYVSVPELGTGCVRDPGPDLRYRCGETRDADPDRYIKIGGYQVSIPVSHTGSTTGLKGTSRMFAVSAHSDDWSQDYIGPRNDDMFPVYPASHFRSSAEVRMVAVTASDVLHNQAEVVTTVTVVPGETVTSVDLGLDPLQWRATGTNAGQHGIQCFVRRVAVPSLHCRPAPGERAFPAGRFQLVVDLAYTRRSTESPYFSPVSTAREFVEMSVDGEASTVVDDFYWNWRQLY